MVLNSRKRLKREMERALREFLEKVSGDVLVYGSFARGDFNERSDIDVIVVTKELPGKFMEKYLSSASLIEAISSRLRLILLKNGRK